MHLDDDIEPFPTTNPELLPAEPAEESDPAWPFPTAPRQIVIEPWPFPTHDAPAGDEPAKPKANDWNGVLP